MDLRISKRTALLLLLDIVATYVAYWLASVRTDVRGFVFVNNEIYFMLGTNELGNVWEDFTKSYRVMMSETRRLFPDAIIYAIGVPYVEEAKVTTGDYINNANVDKMNNIILNICDEGGYYFLDVNEVLSDGNHSLISGASSDGVHMYEEYCKKMLDYLKTHYVSETSSSEAFSESSSETSSETESETSSETETAASN